MAVRACVSSLVVLGLACRKPPRAGAPADAGTVVTVYVPPRAAERMMGPIMNVASQHQWVLSLRTDSEAVAEADLILVDSAGRLVGRVRPGATAAAQARLLIATVLRGGTGTQ